MSNKELSNTILGAEYKREARQSQEVRASFDPAIPLVGIDLREMKT